MEKNAVEAGSRLLAETLTGENLSGEISPSDKASTGSILSLVHGSRGHVLGVKQKYRNGTPSLESR